MRTVEIITTSAADTERVAAAIAPGLAPGDIVALEGDVGTGKTTFVRAACRALGVSEPVTSPTFTLGRRYNGRVPVSHVDLYRLGTLEAEVPGLLDDYLDGESIVFIEWPKSLALVVSETSKLLSVHLSHLGQDRRRLALDGDDELVLRVAA
jgi:tRNA threonylcarbamoyladenosine biosynthesis protein TsaE